MSHNHPSHLADLRLSALATALLAVFGTATAAEGDDEVTRLVRPTSSISLGLGYLADDNQRYGMYTGARDAGFYGLADLSLVRRDDATGTWLTLGGRNLGLDNRQIRAEHERQGAWGYFVDYSQIQRHHPYTIYTPVSGTGETEQTIPSPGTASGTAERLKMEREIVKAGIYKALGNGLEVRLRARSEEKDGTRAWGRGFSQFLTEPIDSTTDIVEGTLAYTGERLQLSGGYYGTTYRNRLASVIVNGATDGNSGNVSPLGLPPDNQSHQLYLSGGYNLAKQTRATFKLAYTRATQNDRFIPVSKASGAGDDLDGRVDTTLVYLGLSTRPLPKLAVVANLRYEDRDDRTPVRLYYEPAPINGGRAPNENGTPLSPTSTWDGHNEPRSFRNVSGKLEAAYRLDAGFRVAAGLDYDEKTRNTSPVRAVSYRKRVDETAYRLEVSRSMSDTVNGAIAYVRSERDGSDFVLSTRLNGSAGSNLVAPLHLADRERDKLRLTLDWAPLEPLSLQLMYEASDDEYGLRTFGLDRGSAQFYSLDVGYAVNDDWRTNMWVSRQHTEADQRSTTTRDTATVWTAKLRNQGDAVGIGVQGKLTPRVELAADLQHSLDRSEYRMAALSGPLEVDSLPESYYRLTSLQLTGKYALRPGAGLRMDYRLDRYATDDWTWVGWTYADGTQVTERPRQTVHFIGVSGYYRFQ